MRNHDGCELALSHPSIYTHCTRIFLLVYGTVNEGQIAWVSWGQTRVAFGVHTKELAFYPPSTSRFFKEEWQNMCSLEGQLGQQMETGMEKWLNSDAIMIAQAQEAEAKPGRA